MRAPKARGLGQLAPAFPRILLDQLAAGASKTVRCLAGFEMPLATKYCANVHNSMFSCLHVSLLKGSTVPIGAAIAVFQFTSSPM